jgi:hypothetical protein
MYVRDLELNPILYMDSIRDMMIGENKLHIAELGAGSVWSCSFGDLFECTTHGIKQDPYFLLKNREEVLNKGMTREVAGNDD